MPKSQEHTLFNNRLREWRKHRKLSQLDLALAADISQRHVSWLETGKSQPSRDMVIKLADVLNIPLRERNPILNSAGFAKVYSEEGLTEPSMEAFASILHEIIAHHNPFPAFVLDRHWNIKMKNKAADLLLYSAGIEEQAWRDDSGDGEFNIALLTVHPKGLRRFIRNWDEVASPFINRLKKEALDSEDPSMLIQYKQLLNYISDENVSISKVGLQPVLPIEINLDSISLKLYSVISSFGTAQDITANDIRIETFYPADEFTGLFLKGQ